MKRALITLVGTIALSLAHVAVSMGAMDAFLLIQGLKGESKAPGRADWSNVIAVSWAHGLPPPGSPTTAKVVFQPVLFTKIADAISPSLAMAAANGQPFPTAVLELVRAGDVPQVYLRVELFDVRVVSYAAGGHSGGELPSEEFKISYSRVRWTAFKFQPNGQPILPPIVNGWDVVNNKSF